MLKAVVNITMAILVVLSSGGLMLGKHYCGGELRGVSLFSEAKSCHQEETPPCHKHTHQEGLSRKNCCNDQVTYIKGIDLETSTTLHLDWLPEFDFTPIALFVIAELRPVGGTEQPKFYNFHPPPIVKDIPVFVQSFLL